MEFLIESLKGSFTSYAKNNAFCINNSFYTYEVVGRKSQRIAHLISEKSKNKRVGIITNNDLETYASIFACWFCGYAYVPINPKIPFERNSFVIQEAAVDLLISSTIFDNNESFDVNVIYLDESELIESTLDFDFVKLRDEDFLYILFTSGSTGVPKGVPINYKNLKSFVDSYFSLDFDFKQDDRFLQMYDLTFDLSVVSYLFPLLIGACIYTVPAEGVKYMQVYKILRDHKITVAAIVPSILNYLKTYFDEIYLPDIKYCFLTAEASNIHIVKEWFKCIPNSKVANLYGPTEATIYCTAYNLDVENPKSYNDMVAIGKPFKNITAIIIDENNEETVHNRKGELCVSGDQITVGYLNNEEKNKGSFFNKNQKRFYRTGDLCYSDETGDLYYCGRIDHQVKIQGFRIELSEIELAVRELFKVNNVAINHKNNLGIEQITLFIEKYKGETETIISSLEKKLPYYMVPSHVRIIEEFPYNTSGKVDRVSLRSSIYENAESYYK